MRRRKPQRPDSSNSDLDALEPADALLCGLHELFLEQRLPQNAEQGALPNGLD